eukprot:CAMPEP_0116935634 /NCGR_PEP_ID=MMETSP0467-20121206/30399_1 /TAXON_ID=283647 /ORGANISM="Mesodinium pulex, Strain SPMC105" /LENGTH=156 /DNA_ID=CAMNT_0004617043 /DNA_START=1560 /DNA_END=2027 /DNA_ORIENTATION=-
MESFASKPLSRSSSFLYERSLSHTTNPTSILKPKSQMEKRDKGKKKKESDTKISLMNYRRNANLQSARVENEQDVQVEGGRISLIPSEIKRVNQMSINDNRKKSIKNSKTCITMELNLNTIYNNTLANEGSTLSSREEVKSTNYNENEVKTQTTSR